MKNYFIKLFPVIIMPVLASCSMAYINTSELREELKKTMEKISNESKSLDPRFSKSQELMIPYKICTESNKHITNSNNMLTTIGTNINQLKIIESKMNDEFKNFTNYSLNKPIIVEKMPEWQKAQETKRLFSESITLWDNQVAILNNSETQLSKYISDSLATSINKIIPNDEIMKINDQINTLNTKFNDAISQFSNIKSSISDKIKKYKILFPDVVKKIETELNSIESKYNELSSPAKELIVARDAFKNKIQNLSVIYSCQSEWKELIALGVTSNEKLGKFAQLESEIQEKRTFLDNLLSKLK
jgi:hypothetical protein